jgi:hypothetical protein
LILQFGLCVFKAKDSTENPQSYEATAYNCFLFPRSQNSKYSEDISFSSLVCSKNISLKLLKSSNFYLFYFCLKNTSIEFLSSQNFDFNKVFGKGITFMSKDHEEKIRTRLEKTINDRSNPKGLLYPSNSNNKDVNENINKIM